MSTLAIPAYASDLTIFGAAQHQGKLTLQSTTQTATQTSNLDPRTFGVFGVRYSHGKIIGGEHTLAYLWVNGLVQPNGLLPKFLV